MMAIFHRPWWKYYLVHFNLPLALLAGYAVRGILPAFFPAVISETGPFGRQSSIRARVCFVAALGAFITFAIPNHLRVMGFMMDKTSFEEHEVAKIASQYRQYSEWCYTTADAVAFAAGLLIPPEFTVISYKRMLVERLTSEDLLAKVKQVHPRILILLKNREITHDERMKWLKEEYSFVAQGAKTELWISNEVEWRPEIASSDARIQYLRELSRVERPVARVIRIP